MSIKVLVADDSITIQKVIGIIFGGDEYSLTVVDNGKAAVDKAREINPDILLIDALMPGMTGYEVAEAIRSTPSLADKPILILTGSFEPFDEEKAKKCGADDFISKPFESQQLIAKVKELLDLGNSRARSVQAAHPQPDPEILREQAPEISVPIDYTPTPAFDQHPAALQPTAPADIWGAFTPEVEAPVESIAAPLFAAPSSVAIEPDVFAIVTEESDAQLVQSAVKADATADHTGSQWVPVEETTFEFEEETIEEPPQPPFAEQAAPFKEAAFGDISFEDDVATPVASAFTAVTVITPPSVSLTEEQLKAAITSASKEVIERIVWEVVPDLAEALIRDAIRKIKEGI